MRKFQYRIPLTSGEIAKARAGLAVAADRMDCNPELIGQMRREMTDVLAKYINTDDESTGVSINFFCKYMTKWGISDVKTIPIK
ncbi:MAG: cell division topological specificity factor MinE [Lachnospiraceae bacterium]|nr:cell division topological specificity factor MinE [Lachnospiraceae bacterium]